MRPAGHGGRRGTGAASAPGGAGAGGSRPSRRRRLALAIVVALAAVAVALGVAWATGAAGGQATDGQDAGAEGDGAPAYVSYREFSDDVDAGRVETVTIDAASETLTFTLADDPATYRTDDPDSPDLKERLLLAGVDVSVAQPDDSPSADDILNGVVNWGFNLLFFGGIAYGLWRWASYSRSTFRVVRQTGVTFADVAGMYELKAELRQVVDVLKNPQAYERQGVRPVKGIVLEGPPGNGKTLFARALAQEAGVSFIATKGADFQSAIMSLGARKIRTLFRKAARHKPCIVFIDEFDSIGERRSYGGMGIDKENNRIITAMLNEMDGFVANDGILVVAATNSYRSLDPALVRPGRFDLKFTVGNPDEATRAELVELYTRGKGRELADGLTPRQLVEAFDGLSCAAIEAVLNGAATLALGRAEGACQADGAGAGDSRPRITMELVREAARKADVRLAQA